MKIQKPAMLLVEDDGFLRDMLKDRLTEAGWAVTTANSADQAILLFFGKKYDLVSTDLDLGDPRKSGFNVTQAIRAIDKDVHIVMFSGNYKIAETLFKSIGGSAGFEKPDFEKYLSHMDAMAVKIKKRRAEKE